MRFVIIGAGAVGGVIGARLWKGGHAVCLVARGAHLAAVQREGLVLERPEGRSTLPIPALEMPEIEPGDVVILAVKSQDTAAALERIPAGTLVVCAQNGVENEPLVARRGPVLGMLVWLHAVHLHPGVVALYSSGTLGVLDLGPWSQGVLVPEAESIAEALRGVGFESVVRADIRAWKHTKLLCNLPGALAAAGRENSRDLARALVQEGRACFAAAGLAHVPVKTLLARCDAVQPSQIESRSRPGGSMWQSHQRASGSEIEWLNGFVVRLGREFGVPTPLNADLVRDPAFRMNSTQGPGHSTEQGVQNE